MCSVDKVQYSIINHDYNFINGLSIVDFEKSTNIDYNKSKLYESSKNFSSTKKHCLGNSSSNNNNNSHQVIYNWVENICKQTLDPRKRHLQVFS